METDREDGQPVSGPMVPIRRLSELPPFLTFPPGLKSRPNPFTLFLPFNFGFFNLSLLNWVLSLIHEIVFSNRVSF